MGELFARAISSEPDGLTQRVDTGGHAFTCDEPLDLGGNDQGPTPHELLVASLAACSAITLRAYAARKGIELGDVRVETRLHRDPRGDAYRTTVEIEGELEPQVVAVLQRVAAKCPVKTALATARVAPALIRVGGRASEIVGCHTSDLSVEGLSPAAGRGVAWSR